jgi:hypothetical protein
MNALILIVAIFISVTSSLIAQSKAPTTDVSMIHLRCDVREVGEQHATTVLAEISVAGKSVVWWRDGDAAKNNSVLTFEKGDYFWTQSKRRVYFRVDPTTLAFEEYDFAWKGNQFRQGKCVQDHGE